MPVRPHGHLAQTPKVDRWPATDVSLAKRGSDRSGLSDLRSDLTEDRITVRIPIVTLLLALVAIIGAGTHWLGANPPATQALLTASTANEAGLLQAGTIRLQAVPSTSPAFTVPSLLPGEAIERVFTVTQGGSTDASFSLAVVAETQSRLALDPEQGIQVEVTRCLAGDWVANVSTTRSSTFECQTSNGGGDATVQALYQGPIVPVASLATAGSRVIPISDRVPPGEPVRVRLRASLPIGASGWAQETSTTGTDRTAAVALDWRAYPVMQNIAGIPLATQVSVPAQSTPIATAIPPMVPPTPVPPGPTPFPEPTAITQPPPQQVPAGYPGYAIALDGAGDAVELSGSPTSLATKNAWTMEAWIRPDAFTGPQAIYTENVTITNGAGGMVLGIGLMDRDIVVGGWSDTAQPNWTWSQASIPPEVAPATWFHVAATRSASVVTIYVNGVALPGAVTPGASWNSMSSEAPSSFYIGRAANPGEASYFRGQVDDVRLWSVARSPSEIATSRRQRLWGNEYALTTYLPVSGYPATASEGRGAAIKNLVTGSYSGVLRGGVRYVASGADITIPPSPYQLAIDPTSDSGSKGDLLTNAASVSVTGLAEPTSLIALYRNSELVASDVVAALDGKFVVPSALPIDGAYTFTATARSASGQPGLMSVGLVVSRDATPPGVPSAVTLSADSDTFGVGTTGSSTDGITRVATPTIIGAAESGSVVTIYHGSMAQAPTVIVGGSANWAWTPATGFGDGNYSLTAKASDAAGNTSVASAPFNLVIDTVATAPVVALLSGGASTTDTTPTLAISGESGAIAALTVDGATAQSVVLNNGSGTVTVQIPLAVGSHVAHASITDLAGNQSNTTAFSFTISTIPCTALFAGGQANGVVTGSFAAGQSHCYSVIPSSTSLNIDTCDTSNNADTWIELYDGDGTRVAFNDDSCGLRSQLSVTTVVPAQPYTIRIKGFDDRLIDNYILKWAS